MSDELYPELTENGKEEAQQVINAFKEKMSKVADGCISDFYCDVSHYIESDHWTNFRTSILHGLCNYKNAASNEYDFKRIRQAIYKEHKEQIDKDLNQDLLSEIDELKRQIQFMHESRGY